MGKASFAEIQDDCGRIQLYLNRDEICKGEDKSLYNEVFKKLIDIGDIIFVKGNVFKTKLGEVSVNVRELTILSKSLRPLPLPKVDSEGKEYDSFSDPESRYRQRYVDLIVNPEVKETFILRTKLTNSMRSFLNKKGYLEVETPILQPIYGGASAKPFVTHHNKLDMELYLRIAPELYLKRLIIGGFEKVFEINRSFRNEGLSVKHNPEFTMIEFYAAFEDYHYLMNFIEELFKSLFDSLGFNNTLTYQEQTIDITKKFERINFHDSIIKFCDSISSENLNDYSYLESYCKNHDIEVSVKDSLYKTQLDIFEKKVEGKLIQPTFITEYPTAVSPLSRRVDNNPEIVERFELFIAGREIANGFSELNDPVDQSERFHDQLATDDEKMKYDEDFITAMEYGMPPTAGAGIGIDRLVMLLTNSASIRDVLFFPLMKPKA